MFDAVLAEGDPIAVSFDGQNDTPGHTAMYCQGTMMSALHKCVLETQPVDKRETGHASITMETFACLRCLMYLVSKGITINDLVSDQHPALCKFFCKYFLIAIPCP
jgi:hypothetical protein